MNRKLALRATAIVALFGQVAAGHVQAAPAVPPFALVKDINTQTMPASSFGGAVFATLGNVTLFSSSTPSTGAELWRTDGTESGTRLVKDINPGSESSMFLFPSFASSGPTSVVLSNTLLFVADDGATGQELWRTDGTASGTTRVKDTWPGAQDGIPKMFVASGDGRVFFVSQVAEARYELWITDGTPAGTTLLHAFEHIMTPMTWTSAGLLFGASESNNDIELWISDGTPSGVRLLKDIFNGTKPSTPQQQIALNSTVVLFSATDSSHGEELWRSAGTSLGTALVKDICPGAGGSGLRGFAALHNHGAGGDVDHMVFGANDCADGFNLWVTDGSTDNTQILKDVATNAVAGPPSLLGTAPKDAALPARAFYAIDDGVHGSELWITDGTLTGIVMLTDVNPGFASSDPDSVVQGPAGVTFFLATSADTGHELWKTDGTPQGTALVDDIYSGTQDSRIESLVVFSNTLYFSAIDGVHGRELWRSDSTRAGTRLVKDITPGPVSGFGEMLSVSLGTLYFIASDGVSGYELWKTDGSDAGTVRLKNIAPDAGGIFLDDYSSTPFGDRLLMGLAKNQQFAAASYAAARPKGPGLAAQSAAISVAFENALWQSDGTAAGTTRLKTFSNGGFGGWPYGLVELNGGVLFGAADRAGANELWHTDGTAANTTILTSTVRPAFGDVRSIAKLNGLVVFGVVTSTQINTGQEYASIWRTDGTPRGTTVISANVDFSLSNYAVSGNTLFFEGSQYDNGNTNDYELWKTDGTPAGTARVKDIISGLNGSYPHRITPGQPGSVFFIAATETGDSQLWRSDGTEAGTVFVADARPGFQDDEYGELANVNGTLFFAADDGLRGTELWKSDGTSGGTALIADLFPGGGASSPQNFAALGGMLFFSATGPDGVRTLWRSDGTGAGTHPVRADANAPHNPAELKAIQGGLMFSAADDAHGNELWVSNGTAAGTVLAQDLVPGPESSNPGPFFQTSGHVFLAADTPGIGRELWARPLASPPTPTPDPGLQRKIYLPLTAR